MSCDVGNVIYVMTFMGCGEKYIGDLLRQTFTLHGQQIRDPSIRMLQVREDIANCANAMTPKYDAFLFYKMYSESTT